jgi:hypothetical protein
MTARLSFENESALARLLLASGRCAASEAAWLNSRLGHADWLPDGDRGDWQRLREIAAGIGLTVALHTPVSSAS